MEGALRIWQQEEMPKLNLKTPWYGDALGLWDDEDDRLASWLHAAIIFNPSK